MNRIKKFPQRIQKVSEDKGTPPKEIDHPHIFKYFRKHQVQFNENTLRKQIVKKRDIASLNFSEYTFSNKGLRRHALAIQSSRKLSKINLSTMVYSKIQWPEFAKFCEALKRQRYLRHFHLRLPNMIDEPQLKGLARGLKRLRNFWSLNLFLCSDMMEQTGMKSLSKRLIRKLCRLRQIRLSSENTNTTNEGFKTLGKACKKLIRLQNLHMKFKWTSLIGLQGLGKGLKRGRKTIQNIIIENMDTHYAEDEKLKEFSENLKEFGPLENVCIESFQFREISNEGLNTFGQTFTELCFLKSLNISLINCRRLSKKGLKTFSQSLESLYYLNTLRLELNSCPQIDSEGISLLSQGLKKLLTIKHISLHFLNCCEISDNGLEALAQMLKQVNWLESFTLENSRKTMVTNKGLQALSQGLQVLGSLQKLQLNFEQNNLVNDKGMECLIQSFEKLGSLRELQLKFTSLPCISNEILEVLVESLEKIESLRNVYLRFCICRHIDEDGISVLQTILRDMRRRKGLKYELAYGHTYDGVNYY